MPKKKRQAAKEKALHVASKVSAKVQDGVHMMARRVQGEDKDAEEGAGLLMDDGVATHAHEAMTARRGGGGWQDPAVSDEVPMHRSPEHDGNGADEIAAVPRKGSERDHGHKGAHAEQAEEAIPSRKVAAGHRNDVEMAKMNNHNSRSKYSAVQIEVDPSSPPVHSSDAPFFARCTIMLDIGLFLCLGLRLCLSLPSRCLCCCC
jgi:hypothetical protein